MRLCHKLLPSLQLRCSTVVGRTQSGEARLCAGVVGGTVLVAIASFPACAFPGVCVLLCSKSREQHISSSRCHGACGFFHADLPLQQAKENLMWCDSSQYRDHCSRYWASFVCCWNQIAALCATYYEVLAAALLFHSLISCGTVQSTASQSA